MATTREFDSYPTMPYWTKIRPSLFEILTTLENKIDRDMRAKLNARSAGTPVWLLTHIRVAENTWRVVEELAFERQKLNLPLDISVAIPPLVRVIGDSLFTVIFAFEDLSTRLPWFWKSTWREICEEYDDLSATYGGQSEWSDHLKNLAAQRDKWRDDLPKEGAPLSAAELADPSQVRWWPNPGAMRRQTQDPHRQAVLDHLLVRFYGPLSGASHLSGRGLMTQSTWLAANDDVKKKHFSDQVLRGITLLLGLISQVTVDAIKDPPLARRVVSLWNSLIFITSISETYTTCFQARIEALAAQ